MMWKYARRSLAALALFALVAGCSVYREERLAKEISEVFKAAHEDSAFDGVVLVALQDSILVHQAFGMADREANKAISPISRFRIASVTKPLTAYLVLRLAEEGKIDLDAAIGTYLPDWNGHPGITVHQLLSNTSGVAHYEGLEAVGLTIPAFRPMAMTADAFVDMIGRMPLACDPGSCFHYSSFGYDLLGAVVESATGMSYADALETHVTGPLDMQSTGYATAYESVEELVSGYEPVPTDSSIAFEPAIFRDPSNAYAAGGLYSNAEDLLRWSRALQGDGPLGADWLALMQTDHVGERHDRVAYGYGLAVHNEDRNTDFGDIGLDKPYVIHGGSFDGFRTLFVSAPHATLVILSNSGAATSEIVLGRAVAAILNNSE